MFVLPAIAILVSLRVYWQSEPGFAGAALFWCALLVGMALMLHRFKLLRTPFAALLLAGFGLNALVTLVNGGYMPVAADTQHPLYQPLDDSTRLPWLADVFPMKSSLGDWLVLTAALVFFWRFGRAKLTRTSFLPS